VGSGLKTVNSPEPRALGLKNPRDKKFAKRGKGPRGVGLQKKARKRTTSAKKNDDLRSAGQRKPEPTCSWASEKGTKKIHLTRGVSGPKGTKTIERKKEN